MIYLYTKRLSFLVFLIIFVLSPLINAYAVILSFTERYVYDEGTYYRARAVTTADLDEDGDMDVIVGDSYQDVLLWYDNNGSEVFTKRTLDASYYRASQVQVIDFDQDGDLDIVGGDNTSYQVLWWKNDGSESFTEYTVSSVGSDFSIVDIDADGDYDVVTPDWSSGLSWAKNDGSMNFSNQVIDAGATFAWSVCTGDLTGDGNIDIVTNRYNSTLYLYTNDGSENFSSSTIDTGNGTLTLSCTDLDDDGDLDVISAPRVNSSIYWYSNNGTGTLSKTTLYDDATLGTEDFVVIDFDGDGDDDVVTVDDNHVKVYWFDNDGSENFTRRTIDSYYLGVTTVSVADIDGDTDLDVVAGSYENGQDLMWYEAALDVSNPIINTLSPADDATSIATSANLVMTFNEAVDVETGDIVIKTTVGDTTFETISLPDARVTGTGTTTITINPSGTLAQQTGYYVQVATTAFDDPSGNSYAGITDTTSWSFTTADETSPTMSTLSPADNAVGITTTSDLVMTFDEVVDVESGNIVIKTTVGDTTFETISLPDARVTGTGTNTITINPSGTLAEGTEYYVQVATTAFDDPSGNSYAGIADTTSWSFTTGDFTNPVMSILSPADGATGVATSANLVITFNEAVDVETGDIVIKTTVGDTTFETISLPDARVTGTGTNTITINPSGTLAEQTEYYVQIATTAFDDTSSNSYAGITDTTSWSFTTADETNPTVTVLSPVDNATGVSGSTNLVITFTEAVDVESGNIVIKKTSGDSTVETIDVTGGQVTGTGTNTITVDPSASLLARTEYYIQIDATAFDDASSNSYAGIADTTSWSFTILGTSSSSSPSVPTPTFYSIDDNDSDTEEDVDQNDDSTEASSPKALLTLINDTLKITWSSSSSIHLIDLFISFDGASYNRIASNILNNEIYKWKLPVVCPGEVAKVKVIGTDLATILGSVETNEISLNCIIKGAEDDSNIDEIITDNQDQENASDSDESDSYLEGPSPVTGEIEKIEGIKPGDYIRSPYFSTVYYIDENLSRRPFINTSIFFTYEDSFVNVRLVTDATLATIKLGQVMLPNSESVLIKIESDPRTYSIDDLGQLRWIESEQIATDIYGTDWADYIIDIEPTFFKKFSIGENVTSPNQIIKTDKLKKRELLIAN